MTNHPPESLSTPLISALDPEKLLTEKLHLAISGYPHIALANWLSSILVYIALLALDSGENRSHMHLHLWLVSQSSVSITWIILYWRYHQESALIRHVWENFIDVPTSIWSGLNWGILWVLAINPDDLQTAFVLNAAICGVVAGTAIGNPMNLKGLIATLLPCLLPVITKALWLGGSLFYWIALVAIVLLAVSITLNMVLQKLYLTTLQQREENARLAHALTLEKQQVERTSAEKTRFLAAASHDLRQPIQAMRLFEGALAATLTTTEQHELLDKISAAGKNLSQLLDKLLDISQLDSGIIQPKPIPIVLDDLLYQLQQQYTELASEQNIDLITIPTRLHSHIDPLQLERILNNLISNAIRHMQRPGKILLGVRQRQGRVLIEVWDNGQGIPWQAQDKIFDEFYQVNNPERNRSKGLGLGLPIVKRLCHLNNCELRFRSQPNKGCYFGILLPTAPANTLTLPVTSMPTSDKNTLPLPTLAPNTPLLLLEDDQEVSLALQTLLRQQGFHVTLAQSIDTALQSLTQQTPAVILSDYQLPQGENGLEAIARLREAAGWKIPALILTGNTAPTTVKALNQQPLPVLYKPIEAKHLYTSLNQLINS